MEDASTPTAERVNPLHRFTGSATDALDRMGDAPAWAMSPDEQAETLVELTRMEARLTELRWRVLAAAERNQIGDKDGATSTAAWLSRKTRLTRTRANGDLRGAMILDDPGYAPTRAALATGAVHEEQAWVIIRAIEDLPADEVSEAQRLTAQRHLIELAATHDAKQLRVLARRLFEVLAPDEADRREGEALEREEQRARQRCRFAMRDNGDGTSSGWFKLPTLQAELLGKAVQAFAAPRRQDPAAWRDPEGKKVPYPQLLGRAFAELVEHLPTDALPQAGGTAATVVVTLDLDVLRSGLGAASLDTGGRISAAEARRLACNSGLVPAVLGTGSVPLDLGRTTRLHTSAQRTAMAIRDRGCTADGCDRPPAWCQAHHETPWSHGGTTTVDAGRLLCPRHHQLAHDSRYDMRRLPSGQVRLHQRT
jgi:hypothetical protein